MPRGDLRFKRLEMIPYSRHRHLVSVCPKCSGTTDCWDIEIGLGNALAKLLRRHLERGGNLTQLLILEPADLKDRRPCHCWDEGFWGPRILPTSGPH